MNNRLCIKIYYRINGNQDIYGQVPENKYLIGGGFYNRDGGSLTFKARNLEEAKNIAYNISHSNKFNNLNFILLPDNIAESFN